MARLAPMENVRCHRWPPPNHAPPMAKTTGYESYENDENSYVGHLDESGEKSYESYEDDENNYFGHLLDERGEKIYVG